MAFISSGTVYLVGAGPGDPDLLTVKAQRLISECQALVYDSLVPLEVLDLAPQSAHLYFVGKRRGHHSIPQTKTNQFLLDLAQQFKCVVRLKGGDPFLFGRGGEEAAYLDKKGIKVEVVPGITAGIAAPAYLGIPVTHRLAGSSVTFVTGHEGIDKRRPSVDWRGLAKTTTCFVIYMGIHNLDYIASELIAGGLEPSTPSVVIQQGTVIGQNYIKTSLSKLVECTRKHGFSSPAIIMIGSVIDYQVKSCICNPAHVTMPIDFDQVTEK